MQTTIEAIYENGVFKPLEKVNLAKKFSGIGGYKGKLD